MTEQEPLTFDVDPFDRTFGQLRGPLHWPSLTSAEARGQLLALTDWVQHLVGRFAIEPRVIPPCWGRHPGMIEVLSALRDHERGSYSDTASPTAAMDWMRALHEAQLLLTQTAAKTGCTPNTHRDELIPHWASTNPPDPEPDSRLGAQPSG